MTHLVLDAGPQLACSLPKTFRPCRQVGVLPGSALLALLLCCSGLLVNAGLWPTYPCTVGMGIATFDIMAQILSHPLVDVAHVWTTRWKTGTPNPWGSASSEDSLTVRAPGAKEQASACRL